MKIRKVCSHIMRKIRTVYRNNTCSKTSNGDMFLMETKPILPTSNHCAISAWFVNRYLNQYHIIIDGVEYVAKLKSRYCSISKAFSTVTPHKHLIILVFPQTFHVYMHRPSTTNLISTISFASSRAIVQSYPR